MATTSIKSGGATLSTVGPDTIKHAFREIMDDEAKHVRVSGISCVGHSMRSRYAPQPENADAGHASGSGPG